MTVGEPFCNKVQTIRLWRNPGSLAINYTSLLPGLGRGKHNIKRASPRLFAFHLSLLC